MAHPNIKEIINTKRGLITLGVLPVAALACTTTEYVAMAGIIVLFTIIGSGIFFLSRPIDPRGPIEREFDRNQKAEGDSILDLFEKSPVAPETTERFLSKGFTREQILSHTSAELIAAKDNPRNLK